jgi:hypothetical protein
LLFEKRVLLFEKGVLVFEKGGLQLNCWNAISLYKQLLPYKSTQQ